MKLRFITSIFIVAAYMLIIGMTFYVHKIFYDIFMLILIFGAAFEVSKAVSKKFSKPINFIIFLHIIIGYTMFYVSLNMWGLASSISAYFAALALMTIAAIAISMFSKAYNMRNVVSTMLVMVYPVSVLVYMLGLAYLPGASESLYPAAILLMFLISTLTDTFAYCIGITFKGPKLCPHISPKKTVSGAIGGVLGGIAGGALVMMCSYLGWLKIPQISPVVSYNIAHFLVIGAVGSLFTQLGDLIASYLKRQCEIKDFSKLLPGHGGIMDRIDGFMINAVFIYIYFLVLSL